MSFPAASTKVGEDDLIPLLTAGFEDTILVQVDPETAAVIRIIDAKFIGTINLGLERTMKHKLVGVIAGYLRDNGAKCRITIDRGDVTGEPAHPNRVNGKQASTLVKVQDVPSLRIDLVLFHKGTHVQ